MTFPHKRAPGCCELCGADVGEENLKPVTLAEPRKGGTGPGPIYHDHHVVYVCDRHPQGGPVVCPRESALPGTSKKRPQSDSLFDAL